MNTVTPRVFVAATKQNDGKTTTSLGLFAALTKRLGRIGFIKPVGQRFVKIDGKRIDEDSVLMDRTFDVHIPIEAMSPIAIEQDFTRKFIAHGNAEHLERRIQHSFDRACWEKDFTIIEGTGHAGVGSVFDLSNARVASLLQSKVLMVTKGGIGRAIDEVALNKALFDKEGVEMVGVILNKVLPEKLDEVQDYVRRGLNRLGIDLLGVMPVEPILANPTLGEICQQTKGVFLNESAAESRRVSNVIIGAMNSGHLMQYFRPGTLVITPGDREDVILAAVSMSSLAQPSESIAGIILSGGMEPHRNVIELLKSSHLAAIASPLDSYAVASSIHSMTVKTLPGDLEKIQKIQKLIEKHVEIDRLLQKLGVRS